MKTKNEDLVEKIVDLELKMFKDMDMDTAEEIVAERMSVFKKMRRLYYSVLSDNTLEILLKDLTKASKSGRNVILEKYAMLSGKIKIMKIHSMEENKSTNGMEEDLKIQIDQTVKQDVDAREKTSFEDKVKVIVEQENFWQNALIARYPLAIRTKCPTEENFKQSLYCELHTWSEESINSYFDDVCLAKKRNINLNEKRFNVYYKSNGQGSLDEVEEILRNKKTKSRIVDKN